MSDHIMISCTFNNKKINIPQKFHILRNFKLLTKHALNENFKHNDIIITVVNYTDPNAIANIIFNEITIIINCIAPPMKVQCTNKYTPWTDKNFIEQAKLGIISMI